MHCAVGPSQSCEVHLLGSLGRRPGPDNPECQLFFLAEGHCEGRLSGGFRAANHPHRRSDGTFVPDFQGVIETDDGAEVLFDYRGYGRAYPAGAR
jgi:hypothetical protein